MKRLILSACAVLLVAAVAVGATYAYFTADTSATNVIAIGNVNISASLDAGDTAAKEVTPGIPFSVRDVVIENKGANAAYIRVQLRPVNMADKEHYSDISVVTTTNLAPLSKDDNGDWYHYKLKLEPKQTVRFSGSATLGKRARPDNMPSGEVLLQYYVEAIQTEYIDSTVDGFPQWPNVDIKEYKG